MANMSLGWVFTIEEHANHKRMDGHLPRLIVLFAISCIIVYKNSIKEVEIVDLPRHLCDAYPMLETITTTERHHFCPTTNIIDNISKNVEQCVIELPNCQGSTTCHVTSVALSSC
jgi:hypothetical protein